MRLYKHQRGDTILHVLWVLVLLCLVVLAVILAREVTTYGRNSTDPEGGRSGMSLYVDAATGCNYLSRGGGLTPRLRADGSHWCDLPAQKAQ